MRNTQSLFLAFLRNPLKVGAISPSSPSLAQKITQVMDKKPNGLIVELGPGTGAITKFISQKVISQKVISIELDKKLYNNLLNKYHNINFINDNATNLTQILEKNNLPKAQLIISGLPWAIFSYNLQEIILNEINQSLNEDGCFSTFAYVQGLALPSGIKFKKLLNQTFDYIETSPIVWKNLPPAIIYRCHKKPSAKRG